MAHYVHYVPGRLRIKSAFLKRNEAGARQVRELLAGIEGVAGAQTNSVTGSVLISYDTERTSAHELLHALKRAGYCCRSTQLPDGQASFADRLAGTLSDAGERAGKAAVGVLVEKMVERSALALIGAVL
jgi:hypothetical protein